MVDYINRAIEPFKRGNVIEVRLGYHFNDSSHHFNDSSHQTFKISKFCKRHLKVLSCKKWTRMHYLAV